MRRVSPSCRGAQSSVRPASRLIFFRWNSLKASKREGGAGSAGGADSTCSIVGARGATIAGIVSAEERSRVVQTIGQMATRLAADTSRRIAASVNTCSVTLVRFLTSASFTLVTALMSRLDGGNTAEAKGSDLGGSDGAALVLGETPPSARRLLSRSRRRTC